MAKEETPTDTEKSEFGIQRIYIKHSTFHSPDSPNIFKVDWKPSADVQVNSKNTQLGDGIFEVVLIVKLDVKVEEKPAFTAELEQAGIFTIKNFPEKQQHQLIHSYCSTVLFPYAREALTGLVVHGGFPQLYLSPINFDAVYQQQLQKEAQATAKKSDDA